MNGSMGPYNVLENYAKIKKSEVVWDSYGRIEMGGGGKYIGKCHRLGPLGERVKVMRRW